MHTSFIFIIDTLLAGEINKHKQYMIWIWLYVNTFNNIWM